MVFPGATHNRFEHCCGVAHLCSKQLDEFESQYRQMNQSVPFTDNEKKCVVLAGLLHDVGHGIYSHLFDRGVIKKLIKNQPKDQLEEELQKKSIGWEHEDASCMFIKQIFATKKDEIEGFGLYQDDM